MRYVVVPQWQGSGSSRAMRLADGALAIMGDLPSSRTSLLEVPLGAGEALGTGVARFSSIRQVHDDLLQKLGDSNDPALVIGGDCGIELAAIEHALTLGPDTAVVWLDAHPDLGALDSARPRPFCGTVARAVLGEGADGLTASPALAPSRFLPAGTRNVDDDERAFLDEHGIAPLTVDALTGTTLADAVAATGAEAVYVHVDLDVLDPSELAALADPQPFGVPLTTLVAELRALVARVPLIGGGITMFSPESPDAAPADLPVVLRILSALTAPRAH